MDTAARERQITTLEELDALYEKPAGASLMKEIDHISDHYRTFIQKAPFMVLATQNPIEYEGTFPLPEAQLDRFLLRIRLGYPALSDEIRILELQQLRHPIEDLQSVVTTEELQDVQQVVRKVFMAPAVKRYIVEMVRQTRMFRTGLEKLKP